MRRGGRKDSRSHTEPLHKNLLHALVPVLQSRRIIDSALPFILAHKHSQCPEHPLKTGFSSTTEHFPSILQFSTNLSDFIPAATLLQRFL